MKRVIITADYLIETFGWLGEEILIHLMAPFAVPEARAVPAFDDLIASLERAPSSPGKDGAISAMEDLRSAYTKMTIFEKEAVRKDLPVKLAAFLRRQASRKILK